MRYFNVIIFVMSISTAVSAQVDTLQLVEIGSIQAPSGITELYVEDLDGDSLKEIIICTDYYVYIYNSQTYQVEWTSPPLNAPTDLLFADINGNGLIDFSVKDNTNIHLFDPHTPQTIWISPSLDSTYSCYTIGDRNNDDWIDVGIVRVERYGDISDYDTAIVNINDGPGYTDEYSFNTPLISLVPPTYSYQSESPKGIYFEIMTSYSVEKNTILIPTHLYSSSGNGRFSSSGRIKIFNSLSFNLLLEDSSGYMLHQIVHGPQGHRFLYSVSLLRSWSGPLFPVGESSYYAKKYSPMSLIDSYLLWGNYDVYPNSWHGFACDDMLEAYSGPEICYAAFSGFPAQDWTKLFSTDSWGIIWDITGDYGIIFPHLYRNPSICINPLVVSGVYHRRPSFINCTNGNIEAVTDHIPHLYNISDLDFDGNDEVISVHSDSVNIYHLDVVTSIGDEHIFPQKAYLNSNYPNPFNSSTTIEYGLPEAGRVRIDIYDLLGRKVETLVNEEMQAGRHQAVWDASGYSSGVYFYRIEAADFVDTRRMVYLR